MPALLLLLEGGVEVVSGQVMRQAMRELYALIVLGIAPSIIASIILTIHKDNISASIGFINNMGNLPSDFKTSMIASIQRLKIDRVEQRQQDMLALSSIYGCLISMRENKKIVVDGQTLEEYLQTFPILNKALDIPGIEVDQRSSGKMVTTIPVVKVILPKQGGLEPITPNKDRYRIIPAIPISTLVVTRMGVLDDIVDNTNAKNTKEQQEKALEQLANTYSQTPSVLEPKIRESISKKLKDLSLGIPNLTDIDVTVTTKKGLIEVKAEVTTGDGGKDFRIGEKANEVMEAINKELRLQKGFVKVQFSRKSAIFDNSKKTLTDKAVNTTNSRNMSEPLKNTVAKTKR